MTQRLSFKTILTLFLVVSAFISLQAEPPKAAGGVQTVVETPYPGDRPMWDFICSHTASFQMDDGIGGLILPHHFSDQFEIMAAWRSAATRVQPSTIVILSPDHNLAGTTDITIGHEPVFRTVYGEVHTESRLAESLAGKGSCSFNDPIFTKEHGIYSHTAFISRFFPGARILPVLIKWGTPQELLDRFAEELKSSLPENALVVASVDFSHYNPVAISRFHDVMSEAAILSGDGNRILKSEIDSPGSIYILNQLMSGRARPRVLLHTQLQDHFEQAIADNTSHFFIAYEKHKPEAVHPKPSITILSLPFVDTTVKLPGSILEAWQWDYHEEERTARMYPLIAELAGQGEEDRCFMGSDLYVLAEDTNPVRHFTVAHTPVDIVDAASFSNLGALGERIATLAGNGLTIARVDQGHGDWRSGDWKQIGVFLAERGADLVIFRDPEAALFDTIMVGQCTVVRQGGRLVCLDGRDDNRSAVMLQLIWNPDGVEVLEQELSHRKGRPYLADRPSRKSYTRSTATYERE